MSCCCRSGVQDDCGGSGPVRTYIERLRRKLGDNPDTPPHIFTRRHVGYSMEKGEGWVIQLE